jgi:hypothetical protein
MVSNPRRHPSDLRASIEPPEVATLLAERLERWALVRSKVLDRLDLDSARRAERLAERARFLCTTMLLAGDTQRELLITHLHQLLDRAAILMGEPPLPNVLSSLPPRSGETMKESGERRTHRTQSTLPPPSADEVKESGERLKLGTNRIFMAKAK